LLYLIYGSTFLAFYRKKNVPSVEISDIRGSQHCLSVRVSVSSLYGLRDGWQYGGRREVRRGGVGGVGGVVRARHSVRVRTGHLPGWTGLADSACPEDAPVPHPTDCGR
jgi:hypothetical protein